MTHFIDRATFFTIVHCLLLLPSMWMMLGGRHKSIEPKWLQTVNLITLGTLKYYVLELTNFNIYVILLFFCSSAMLLLVKQYVCYVTQSYVLMIFLNVLSGKRAPWQALPVEIAICAAACWWSSKAFYVVKLAVNAVITCACTETYLKILLPARDSSSLPLYYFYYDYQLVGNRLIYLSIVLVLMSLGAVVDFMRVILEQKDARNMRQIEMSSVLAHALV